MRPRRAWIAALAGLLAVTAAAASALDTSRLPRTADLMLAGGLPKSRFDVHSMRSSTGLHRPMTAHANPWMRR